ncbi:MAG: prepilin peptidase [Spirochaetales bacterium]|nr:prepilin peptidase [Spirochaetales bacterium]
MLNHEIEQWVNFVALAGFLIPIVYHDIRRKRIPDVYTITGCLSLLLIRFLFFQNYFIFIDGAIGYIFIWLLWYFTDDKIGLGDAKLSGLIALGLGLIGWCIALFWASFTGVIVGSVLIALKKLKKEESIPFAPFFALGGIISFFTKDLFMRLYYVFQ